MTLRSRAFVTFRALARTTPITERLFKQFHHREKVTTGPEFVHAQSRTYSVVASRESPDARRTGIYLRGGCDLPTVFGITELLRPSVIGTCAVLRDNIHISGSRSDILLQTLSGIPAEAQEVARETARRLQLRPAYFSPRLFDPTLVLPQGRFGGEFPKTAVVLSAAADLTRAAYRHREHGFLVDPGGFWLSNSIETAMANEEDVAWFSKHFKSIGRLTVDEFRQSFGDWCPRCDGAPVPTFSSSTRSRSIRMTVRTTIR
jgi:hypothetical protein